MIKYKKTEKDLGYTIIENIFINDFMPSADGAFVKVYLMGLKLLQENKGDSIREKNLADILGMTESDIKRAYKYWSDLQIVEVENEGEENIYSYVNLKELYIDNIWNVVPVQNDVSDLLDNSRVAEFFANIEFYLRKSISSSEKMNIYNWTSIYNMPLFMIEEAFYFASEIRGVYAIKYVEKIVLNWADKNIRTLEDLDEYNRTHEEKYFRYNKIMKAIGLSKKEFNKYDFEMINSWYDDFSDEMIMEATSKVVNVKSPSVAYVNGVIDNWRKKGFKTVEEVRSEKKPPKVNIKKNFTSTNHQTSKYSKEELEKIARQKMMDAMKKINR